MALNVGINGFGRIGRIIFRTCFQNPCLKVCAINDPAVDIEYICYLIKFDSTHGKFKGTVNRSDNEIIIDGNKICIFREKLPMNIPWQVADVQYVVEASGMFTNLEKASGHLASEGVKRVLVTAPSIDMPMLVLGVNNDALAADNKVISCASSTLYCLAPIIKILEDTFGVSEGFITSIHAMTPSLKPLDGLCLKGKHWRDHRSIHQNIIPATTGACRALGKIIPQVKDKLTGLAFRVPIVNVSVLDISIRLKSNTTMSAIIKRVATVGSLKMQNIIKVSNEQAVSSDFIGDIYSCIVDADSSLQLSSDFFKLICWYENEHSYACRIMDSILFLERQYQIQWTSKISYISTAPKQTLAQQIECKNLLTYHQACSYGCHSNSKSLCSTSQDSGFKSPKRIPLAKKHVPPRNFGTRQLPNVNRESKKNNELFKIWNDVDDIARAPMRHNRSSFFQSCIAMTPQVNTNTYVQTHERLEKVKKEFSKMVNMTENLLKQSQHSKIGIGLSEVPSNATDDPQIEMVKLHNETKLPIDTKNYNNIIIKGQSNDIKAFETDSNKEDVNDEKKENKSMFSVNTYSNKASYKSLNMVPNKSSYSCEEKKTKCFILKSCFRTENTDKDQNKNIAGLNSLMSNPEKRKIKQNTITSDEKNVKDLSILSGTYKEQDKCQNNIIVKTSVIVGQGIQEQSISNKSIICTPIENTKIDQQKPFESKQMLPKASNPLINANNDKSYEDMDTINLVPEDKDNQNEHGRDLQQRLEGILKKLAISNVVSEKPSTCISTINTFTTASNRDIKTKQDIYDKLDSVSATDSENSFHMKERKSQVIDITDLTNSLEDLERLDKICRIIEISDELSDQLLSALSINDNKEVRNKKWSFKEFCEKIKLDEFCDKIFSKNI